MHIRDPERVLRSFPHQLSGGMRQRVLIAAAFSLEPKLIIADEPTTALDVTVQKQILRLIRNMQAAHGTAVIFVTHDLGVVAQICDRVTLLFGGRIVEQGPTAALLENPQHAYTKALLAACPRYDEPGAGLQPIPEALIARIARGGGRLMSEDLLIAEDIEVAFGEPAQSVWSRAFDRQGSARRDGADRARRDGRDRRRERLRQDDARARDAEARRRYGGAHRLCWPRHHASSARSEMRPLRRRMQIIFQDPMASLNPRHTIRQIVSAPMRFHGVANGDATRKRGCEQSLNASACRSPVWTAIRTSSRADSASASALRAPR